MFAEFSAVDAGGVWRGWMTNTAQDSALGIRHIGEMRVRSSWREEAIPPIAGVDLIINLGAPLRVPNRPGASGVFGRGRVWVVGPQDSHLHTVRGGDGTSNRLEDKAFLAARLSLPAAAGLFRGALPDLRNEIVDLDCILGREVDPLLDAVDAAPTREARFARLAEFLRPRLRAGVTDALVWEACRRISAEEGGASISRLAKRLDTTRKTLAKRFGAALGLPPKHFARLTRFRAAMTQIGSAPQDAGWAQIAAAAGYFDQSHFLREFREFTGVLPSAYAQRGTPDQTVVLDAVVTDLQDRHAADRYVRITPVDAGGGPAAREERRGVRTC